MKRLGLLIALALVACSAPPSEPARVGAVRSEINWLQAGSIPAITGNNATIVLWSMAGGSDLTFGATNRVAVNLRCDQAITILYQTNRVGASTWRTQNGSGSGDAVVANTDTDLQYLVLGGNSRLEAVTGGTGPTACEVDVGLFVDRSKPN